MFQSHASAFNPGHVQNIVNQSQKVTGTVSDFFQIIFHGVRQIFFVQRDIVQSDNRIHRCADFVTHAGKKSCFRDACLPGLRQSFF